MIIIIFGGLSGIALLVFALAEGDDDDYNHLEDREDTECQTGASLSPMESPSRKADDALFRLPSAPVIGNGNMQAAMTRQARAGSAPGGLESTLEPPAQGLDSSMDTASMNSDDAESSVSAYASPDASPAPAGRRRRAGLTDLSDSSSGSAARDA